MKRLGTLVFVRHGESVWNVTDKSLKRETRFTGWADIPLSAVGKAQAKASGKCMSKLNLSFDKVFTSLLRRSRHTFEILSKEIPPYRLPDEVVATWRLNERHYGALVGLSKSEAEPMFGREKVMGWRRSWDLRPPPMNEEQFHLNSFNTIDDKDVDWEWQKKIWTSAITLKSKIDDNGNKGVDTMTIDESPYPPIPLAESLEDTARRVLPLWKEDIFPCILNGKTILVVGHSNTIRSMVKHLDNLSHQNVKDVTIPSAIPLVYTFFQNLETNEIKTVGKASPQGMRGRFIVNKELLELSLSASQNLEMSENLDDGEDFKKLISETLNKMENKVGYGNSSSLAEMIDNRNENNEKYIMKSGWMTFNSENKSK